MLIRVFVIGFLVNLFLVFGCLVMDYFNIVKRIEIIYVAVGLMIVVMACIGMTFLSMIGYLVKFIVLLLI